MIRFILGRLLSIALTFTIVSVIVFLMMHAVPGGPFDGNDMPVSDEVKAKLNASLGLDKPLYVQYFKYMWGSCTSISAFPSKAQAKPCWNSWPAPGRPA